MDRAYDSQRKTFLVKETIPKTESRKLSRRDVKLSLTNGDENHCSGNSTHNGQKTFSTQPLDEAMQELLDICQQYNDKLNSNKKQLQNDVVQTGHDNMQSASNQEDSKIICDRDDKKKLERQHADVTNLSQYAQANLLHHPKPPAVPESIEMLQERQAELQRQLDEVLLVAKKLASKQNSNLTDILEDQEDLGLLGIIRDGVQGDVIKQEEEEDELIEFQQIENELRISDIRRQLDNIQEKLRILLFKRLVSNTGVKHQNRGSSTGNSIEQSSPSSSSCSDTTSSAASSDKQNALSRSTSKNSETNVPNNIDVTDGGKISNESSVVPNQDTRGTIKANIDILPRRHRGSGSASTPAKAQLESNYSDQDSAVDTEALSLTTSKESVMSKKNPSTESAHSQNSTKEAMSIYQPMSPYVHTTSPVHPNNFRNNSANSDLERIEEHEDEQDYYRSSDNFRTIYEEKLSPKLFADNQDTLYRSEPHNHSDLHSPKTHLQQSNDKNKQVSYQQLSHSSPHPCLSNKIRGINNDTSGSSRQSCQEATNRPLTLYLPKPDEEIDLVEHVQTLGHDTSIISDDLELSPRSAEGYLWKCCAKNSNKWLKRYFYYDRESKVVAYFKSKSQLTKKNPSPRDTIPFEEISDVYVDHRLSGLGDKGKGRNFVFVLATIGRKYLLATSKAETMRAWIDILFTAAKANDYLEHLEELGDEEESNDVNNVPTR